MKEAVRSIRNIRSEMNVPQQEGKGVRGFRA